MPPGKYERTPEIRAKTSERWCGVPKSDEHRAKISEARRGVPLSAEHRAKLSEVLRGRSLSAETRVKMSEAHRGLNSGEKHYLWKGNAVGYSSLHLWVQREQGKAVEYPCFGCDAPAREWANTDGLYRRDLEDFIPLCDSCHKKHDRKRSLKVVTS